MRVPSRQTITIAVTLTLAAGLAVAGDVERRAIFVDAGGGDGPPAVKQLFHADHEAFDLGELLDGETRTFGAGEHQITATRSGDVVTLDHPGEGEGRKSLACNVGTDTCKVIEDIGGGRTMLWIQKERTCDSAEPGADCDVMVLEGLGDGAHANVVMRHAAIDCAGDDCPQMEVLVQRLGGEGAIAAGHGAFVSADGSVLEVGPRTLRCPEGDATLRVDEDEAGDVFLCPKHAVPLEAVKPGVGRMQRIELRQSPNEH